MARGDYLKQFNFGKPSDDIERKAAEWLQANCSQEGEEVMKSLADLIKSEALSKSDTLSKTEFGEFHWIDGWYFLRLHDGHVRIRKTASGREFSAIIPAAEWASIICAVSKLGETGERWNEAQNFHGREQ